MVPTLQCGLLRSNFCLAILLLSGSPSPEDARAAIINAGGAAVLDRNDWSVNRNSRPGFQPRPGGRLPSWRSAGISTTQAVARYLASGFLISGFLSPAAFCAACSCSTLACRLPTVLLRATISCLRAAISLPAALSLCRASSAFLVTSCCRKLTLLCRQPVRLSSPVVFVQSSTPAIS